ncbi:hypothetical protein QYF36_020408 [Acer negundo]|nr:hypothetical protein QYF36_020408 [Acer negundo]
MPLLILTWSLNSIVALRVLNLQHIYSFALFSSRSGVFSRHGGDATAAMKLWWIVCGGNGRAQKLWYGGCGSEFGFDGGELVIGED